MHPPNFALHLSLQIKNEVCRLSLSSLLSALPALIGLIFIRLAFVPLQEAMTLLFMVVWGAAPVSVVAFAEA